MSAYGAINSVSRLPVAVPSSRLASMKIIYGIEYRVSVASLLLVGGLARGLNGLR